MVSRILITRNLIRFSLQDYFMCVICRIASVCVVALIAPTVVHSLLDFGFSRLIYVFCVSIISSIAAISLIGLTKSEKKFFILKLLQVVKR